MLCWQANSKQHNKMWRILDSWLSALPKIISIGRSGQSVLWIIRETCYLKVVPYREPTTALSEFLHCRDPRSKPSPPPQPPPSLASSLKFVWSGKVVKKRKRPKPKPDPDHHHHRVYHHRWWWWCSRGHWLDLTKDGGIGRCCYGRTDDLVWHVVVAWRSKIWFCRSPGTVRRRHYLPPWDGWRRKGNSILIKRDPTKTQPTEISHGAQYVDTYVSSRLYVAHTRGFYVCEWRFCAYHTDALWGFRWPINMKNTLHSLRGHRSLMTQKNRFIFYCLFWMITI